MSTVKNAALTGTIIVLGTFISMTIAVVVIGIVLTVTSTL